MRTTTELTIPLRDRTGTIIAEAIVDPEDFERIAAHRWCLHHRGHPVRGWTSEGRVVQTTMARAVLGLPPGSTPRVLHRNGDQLDNRRSNLTFSMEWLGRQVQADSALLEIVTRTLLPGWTAVPPGRGTCTNQQPTTRKGVSDG